MTFSVTVSGGMSMKCWCTISMPRAIASLGERKCTGSPLISIWPESGV